MLIANGIILILMVLMIAIFSIDRFNRAINEGQLKFLESSQIKLDKDPFPVNMNMVKFDGKKVLVWPSQAKSTKGKDVIIGEEWPSRMIKPKSPKDGQW
jgi:GH43 family beta-xylosidase